MALHTSLTQRKMPAVGVVLGLGSASIPSILAAASRLVRPIFLLDSTLPNARAMAEQARTSSTFVEITGLTIEEIVDILRPNELKGVTTFSEYALPLTSAIARALELVGHDATTIRALTRKDCQRRVLEEAGVHACRSRLIASTDRSAPTDFEFPAILKPIVGAGSVHTLLVSDEGELECRLLAMPDGLDFILEEYFQGHAAIAGEAFGDYVSVESLRSSGAVRQICVTGKLPLTPSFGETGMFLPCSLPEAIEAEVLALERRAVSALGVTDGITHTEIKLTSAGPRIIEVNGRLGGYLPEILKRASGVDLVRAALQLSLGIMPALSDPVFSGVTYQVFLSPPPGIKGVLRDIGGQSDIESIPGVVQVETLVQPGAEVDGTAGTQAMLGIVYGRCPDHSTLALTCSEITTKLRVELV